MRQKRTPIKRMAAARQTGKLWVIAAVILLAAGAAAYYVLRYQGTGLSVPVSAPAAPAAATGQQTRGAEARNNPPVVLSASITPATATANDRLRILYVGSDPEGDPIDWRFRWLINGTAIQEGPSSMLEPGTFKRGDTVSAEVIGSDQYSSSAPFMTKAVTIGNMPASISDVTLSPEQAFIGTTIIAKPAGSDPDGDDILYLYQWRVNGNAVGGPVRDNTFSTDGLKKRDVVSVVVTGTDGFATSGPVVFGSVMLGNRPPKITSLPPSGLQNGFLEYQATALDADGDQLHFSLTRFPEGMTIDKNTGLVRWELPKGAMFLVSPLLSMTGTAAGTRRSL